MATTSPGQSLLHWFLSIRPWNVLAMGIMVLVAMRWLGVPLHVLADRAMWGWLAVPMLVGAAGNLINDFFDVKEDRINKPKRARIGRTLKRRVVIVTHWGLSVAALCWSGALASHLGSSWPIVFTAALSVVLYIYSPMLKGRGIAGNLAVSLCVAALLVWARMATGRPLDLAGSADQMWLLATVTLWGLNVTREWVKDVQDLKGDAEARHRTMALRLTPGQNHKGIAICCVLCSGLGFWFSSMLHNLSWPMCLWAGASFGCLLAAFRFKVTSLSSWLKVLMGLLFVLMI
ncbi:MAG: UbiA family prenyltransferase [Flavobacteriales bacterium]